MSGRRKTVYSLLLSLFLASCSNKPAAVVPKPVRVQPVEVLSNNSALRYSASIGPSTQLDLAFKVGGYVSSIQQVRGVDGQMRHIQGGDVVRKGTVLATVRQGDYRVKVNEAESQVNEAKDGIEGA